jgi:hypothetical protein
MLTDRRGHAEINSATSGDLTVIAAPAKGHIEIDHLEIMPTGGANTIIIKLAGASSLDNQSPMQKYEYAFDDNQAYVYDRTTANGLECKEATAFIINLSASTKVTGFVAYRVVGE